jgi:hypothetical protein
LKPVKTIQHTSSFYEDQTNIEEQLLDTSGLDEIYKNEKQKVPVKKALIILFYFLMIQLMVFMQGTKSMPSIINIKLCSDTYWKVTAFLPVLILIFVTFSYKYLRREEMIKVKYGYEYDAQDLRITLPNFLKIILTGSLSGFLSGALGAGGGLNLVTFLLAIGINPRVVGATSGFMNMQSTCISIIAVFANGYLTW